MTLRKLHPHISPHLHDDGKQHNAHVLSLPALFIYLQILVIFGASLYLIKLKAPQILGTVSFTAQQIIDLTNAKRTANGLGVLSQNSLLEGAAGAKAANMFSEDYWAHNSPSGKTPWSFITAAGYRYVYAGENLARDFSDASSVVDAWMNSPSHRKNLLDADFREIGVAVTLGKLDGREGTLVVQMFGTPVSQIPATQPLVSASPAPSPQRVAANSSQSTVNSSQKQSSQNSVNSEPATVNPNQATVLASRKFAIARGVSLFLIGFVFMLFLLEVLITVRKSNLKLRPGILAHLSILALALFAVWLAVGGAIL